MESNTSGIKLILLKTISADKQFGAKFNKVEAPKRKMFGKGDKAHTELQQVLLKAAVAK